jgi:hypothetical protein
MENSELLQSIQKLDAEIERAFRGQLWFSYGVSYFEASKCLMKCKQLPQTILFLHYATERLFKALLILNDEMSEKDIKNILNHDGTNYFSLYIAHKLQLVSKNNGFEELKKTIEFDYKACLKCPSLENYKEYIAEQKKETVYSAVFGHFQQYISSTTQKNSYKIPFFTQDDFDIYVLFVRYLREKLVKAEKINEFISKNKHYIFLLIFDLKNSNNFHKDIKDHVHHIGLNPQQIPLNHFEHHMMDLAELHDRIHSNPILENTFNYHKLFKQNPNPSEDEIYAFMFDTLYDIFASLSPYYETLRYPQEDKEDYIAKPLDETFTMDSDILRDLEFLTDIIETVIKLMNTYFKKEIEFWISMILYMSSFLDSE